MPLTPTTRASLTKTGVIAGTPQYMSPEQARGEAVDQRSDLFSLGSVLYAMCTGRAPFRAETSYGVLRRITDEEPRPIRELNPEIPEWLCQIVAKLMSKRPEDRFQSAHEVAALLEQCLAHVQQPTVIPLPTVLITLRRDVLPSRRSVMSTVVASLSRIRFKGVIAVIAALGAGLLGVLFVSATPPDIAGQWTGEGWGQVALTEAAPGQYTGTYTDTVGKEKEPGKIELKWSRIERRFNGTWSEGEDDRFGDLSVRLVDKEIHGGLTTSAKSRINPATPRLADLMWTRVEGTENADVLSKGNSGAAPAAGAFENTTGLDAPSRTVTFDEIPPSAQCGRPCRATLPRYYESIPKPEASGGRHAERAERACYFTLQIASVISTGSQRTPFRNSETMSLSSKYRITLPG